MTELERLKLELQHERRNSKDLADSLRALLSTSVKIYERNGEQYRQALKEWSKVVQDARESLANNTL